jgi:hypothetical protein
LLVANPLNRKIKPLSDPGKINRRGTETQRVDFQTLRAFAPLRLHKTNFASVLIMIKNSFFILTFFVLPLFTHAQIDLEDGVIEAPRDAYNYANENRVEWFKSDGLYGFKNLLTEKVLIQPEYEEIDLTFSDFMIGRKNGQTGVINQKGEIVVPFEFQKIKTSSPNVKKRFPWLLTAKNGFWGLIDPTGRTVEPFEWTEATYYHQTDSLVLLSKPGLQRLLDRQGKTVVETHFDRWETGDGIDRKKLIYARQNGKAGLVDFQNKVVMPFEFENIMWVEDKVVCIFKDNRYGLVTLDGRPILPVEHGIIHSHYAHGLYGVNTPDAQKRGLVDSTGGFILPIEYAQVYLIAGRSLIAAKNMEAKLAIFDLRGKQLTEFLFEAIISRDDVPGLFFGQIGPQQFRLLNGKGEFMSPEVFESVSTSPTAFTASVGWKIAFFRLDGKQVTGFKYGGASGFDSLINRDRMTGNYQLPQGRTWIGHASSNGWKIYIDSEGNEFDPMRN